MNAVKKVFKEKAKLVSIPSVSILLADQINFSDEKQLKVENYWMEA